jgi:hypothetical protein
VVAAVTTGEEEMIVVVVMTVAEGTIAVAVDVTIIAREVLAEDTN